MAGPGRKSASSAAHDDDEQDSGVAALRAMGVTVLASAGGRCIESYISGRWLVVGGQSIQNLASVEH